MAKEKMNNMLSFIDHQANWNPEKAKKTKRTETGLDVLKEKRTGDEDTLMHCPNCDHELKYNSGQKKVKCKKCNKTVHFHGSGDNIKMTLESEETIIKKFEAKEAPKKEAEEKGGVFSKEKELDSNPLFGYAAVRDQEIKKIGAFTSFTKMKSTDTPRERPILNAGQFIETDKVKGYINRIEGDKVYIESLDEPLSIFEVRLKDTVKDTKDKEGYLPISKIESWWELNKSKK